MFGLCKYRNIFGRPGKGIHQYRIFNIPIVDALGTIVLAWFLHKYLFSNRPYLHVLFFTFLLGVILHRIFCVKTPIDVFLFH